jgi:hypothetical protein
VYRFKQLGGRERTFAYARGCFFLLDLRVLGWAGLLISISGQPSIKEKRL